MPKYRVEDDQGNTFVLEGDSDPTEQELEEIFSSQRQPQTSIGPTETTIEPESESASPFSTPEAFSEYQRKVQPQGRPFGFEIPQAEDWEFAKATGGGLPGVMGGIARSILKPVGEAAVVPIEMLTGQRIDPSQPLIPELEPPPEAKGIVPSIRRFAAGLTTPENLGAIAAAPLAPSAVLSTFMAQVPAGVQQSLQALSEAKTPAETEGATADLVLQLAMGELMRRGIEPNQAKTLGEQLAAQITKETKAFKPSPDELNQLVMQRVEPLVRKEPDASQIEPAAEVGLRSEGGGLGPETPLRQPGQVAEPRPPADVRGDEPVITEEAQAQSPTIEQWSKNQWRAGPFNSRTEAEAWRQDNMANPGRDSYLSMVKDQGVEEWNVVSMSDIPRPKPTEESPPQAAEAAPELPPLIPGDRLVTIRRADGTEYTAAYGDKAWDINGEKIPSISRVKDGAWSTGGLDPGEAIVEQTPPPKPPVADYTGEPGEVVVTGEELQQPKAAEAVTIVGKVKGMTADEIAQAVNAAVVEGGMIQGLKRGPEKSGHYVIAPPAKTVPGDQPMAIGPFETKQAAQDFLDSEVGAEGAKVVEVKAAAPKPEPPAQVAPAKVGRHNVSKMSDTELARRALVIQEFVKQKVAVDEPVLAEAFQNQLAIYREARRRNLVEESPEMEAIAKQISQPTPPPATPAQAAGAQPAADWTSATEEVPPKIDPSTGLESYPGGPTELHAGIPLPKFANRKMSQLDQATTAHSGKLQASHSEARRAQKEIKQVANDRRQAAISIYLEANGDIPTLQSWAAAAKGKDFKRAATEAQSLTPEELAIANKAKAAFAALETRGNRYDVLGSHRDNYVPHVWDVNRPGTGWGGGMLKQRFRFAKARTFNTFFEGDQAGFKPKTLAIGKLLPAYLHEMNKVIADRQFVRDMAGRTAKDGRPLVLPRGFAKEVTDPTTGDKAHLVFPRSPKTAKDPTGAPIDQRDYRTMENQPALHAWRWVDKDDAGNPILMQSDLALHPEAYRRLNAMLGESAIRTWYREPVGGTAQIPRAIARGLDAAQSAMKREMFGLLPPFHQVQEGTHAIGHLVNPFYGLEKVDLSTNPAQRDAANHGLMMLPDRASSNAYIEGVGTKSTLLSQGLRKIPKVGEAVADVIDGYQDYLFHQYIPALKFKTYEAMVGRNMKLYDAELKSGELTPSDVKLLSAEQANAAYGHLNYALLDRNPTIQHMLQIGLLAPDFLEARTRFAGQAVKGLNSKVGHEQFKAVAILAAVQSGTAVVLSSLLGVPYDPQHPFEVVYKGRRYAMRSVPEDIYSLIKDTRQFAYGRMNPLTVKGAVQLGTGLNYRGEKVSATDTIGELLAGYIPITARSIPGVRNLTETGRHNSVTPLQQLAGSLGVRISRYSPISETYKLAGDWMDKQKLPRDTGSYPVSKYQQLRYALEDGDMERAGAAYAELRKTMEKGKIRTGFEESINHPFTRSLDTDKKFKASLKGYDLELYNQALRNRKNILRAFHSLNK